jgi:hypothetical protein
MHGLVRAAGGGLSILGVGENDILELSRTSMCHIATLYTTGFRGKGVGTYRRDSIGGGVSFIDELYGTVRVNPDRLLRAWPHGRA